MSAIEEIRFDIEKPERVSAEDSRQLIVIDVDAVGAGYRAIINGCEFELPENIPTIQDALKVAVELAIQEVSKAMAEL